MANGVQVASDPSCSSPQSQSLLHHIKTALINSAASSSSRGKVRLHVLFSVPRHAKDLYPFAHIDSSNAEKTAKEHPVEAFVEHVIMTASRAEEAVGAEQQDQFKQGRMMYALECFLYTLPKQKSSLLYVSKLDSSGWGPIPTPKHLQRFLSHRNENVTIWDSSTSITRVITRAFLSYFANLTHWTNGSLPAVRHISIHILARAQGAYLFPSSNDNKGKHILSDGALIKWWRSLVSSVVCGVRQEVSEGTRIEARPYYLIPGYDRLESHELLPLPPSLAAHNATNGNATTGDQALAEAGWVYGHPYSHKGANLSDKTSPLPPWPLSGPSFVTRDNQTFSADRIAVLLPHFPDDPKSRFIAEFARD
jgi:regulator of Ty1 transposition protein 109